MCGLQLESGQLTGTCTLRDFSLSPRPPAPAAIIANSSTVWGGIVCPAPLSWLGFGLGWVCTGVVCAVSATMSSGLQLPCCVRKQCFLLVIPCLRVLHSPGTLFHKYLTGTLCHKYLAFEIKFSAYELWGHIRILTTAVGQRSCIW